MKRIGLALMVLGLCALAASAGCARKVGDGCTTSTDCDPNGNRVCDLSQPGGYCTIDGCDNTSCPTDSVCIRTFPQSYLTKPCNPQCEDTDCAAGRANDCTDDELCIASGVCARQAFERRYCAATCSTNSDCRGGYECTVGGTHGNFPLLSSPTATAHFCTQLAD
ncbi:MAG TPA: hypothetical protein VH374_19470 [Polyangia bacterium]|nr:hypothetical protein [Polyangia bacterium]